MRKWQNQAAPDDPNVWYAVDGFWPTKRGTYETADNLTGTEAVATAAGNVLYAFCANTLASRREYVVDSARIWQWAAGYTDRTGGVTIGTKPMMAQYGDVTLCVMGVGTATVSSTGGNFAALAGAPSGEIVCVQRNAVLIFNTNTSTDGWAASDVGDYTNWATGEAASGRLIATPGPITAAVPFGNDVIVFKANSIYRMWYAGGTTKWETALLWTGMGLNSFVAGEAKYQVAAGGTAIFFVGNNDQQALDLSSHAYLFDGASAPRWINPLTMIYEGRVNYDASGDRFSVVRFNIVPSVTYFYCPMFDAWGYYSNPAGGSLDGIPLMGENNSRLEYSSMPTLYKKVNANNLTRYAAVGFPSGTASVYLQTSMMGRPDAKTQFSRLTPLLRRASLTASLEMKLYRELHDTIATATRTITQATDRKRFDLLGGVASDNFARFKVTFTGDVEVDEFLVKSKSGGED